MAITFGLIKEHLPRAIAGIVSEYITPNDGDMNAFNCALFGNHELAMMGLRSEALLGACAGGHMEMADAILAIMYKPNLGAALSAACSSGNIEVAKSILARIGDHDLNEALERACSKGCEDAVNLLIDRGANNFARGFDCAACNGHGHIMKLMSSYVRD